MELARRTGAKDDDGPRECVRRVHHHRVAALGVRARRGVGFEPMRERQCEVLELPAREHRARGRVDERGRGGGEPADVVRAPGGRRKEVREHRAVHERRAGERRGVDLGRHPRDDADLGLRSVILILADRDSTHYLNVLRVPLRVGLMRDGVGRSDGLPEVLICDGAQSLAGLPGRLTFVLAIGQVLLLRSSSAISLFTA